ncbi:hypothetical protein [Mesoterricola sediminis]|uniref:Uncharacterized protein n=1 Tax=Mesoterricola sediminis TaxID=2927980 RepID=A0AA48GPI3_9BACT|nr:hypothetical protein [Mesoterricola sediminis]BDU75174.1 hypothetical protein METESE_01320 [Mesoterricola sediminis]
MKQSRKAKRYDDSVLPGDFNGFEPFSAGDPAVGVVSGALRRTRAGVEVGHLTLECPEPPRRSFARLQARAEDLSRQLTYLDERMEIVDHDRRGLYIQLRSLPPYKDEAQIQFNEISIARDRVVLKRIAFHRRDEVKREVPLTLSEETLERLMADLRRVLG